MITQKMCHNASREVRLFIELTFVAVSDATGVYPSELVRRIKKRPVPYARGLFRAILKKHLRRAEVQRQEGMTVKRSQALEVCEDSGVSPIGDTQVGFLLNQDHSAQVHRRRTLEDFERIDAAVWAAWPAVNTMGLFPGLMFNKWHAAATAERFAELEAQA